MEKDRNYRHELKFEIPYGEYVAMQKRLRLIMKPDPHVGEDGRYRIRSIYFDNNGDKALREKINGIAKREKFRIRYYNDDFSFITLEKKIKVNDLPWDYNRAFGGMSMGSSGDGTIVVCFLVMIVSFVVLKFIKPKG
jgi:hypothetical protein